MASEQGMVGDDLAYPVEAPEETRAPGGERVAWRLGAGSFLATSLLTIVGATSPDIRPDLGISTATLTIAFLAQTAGAFVGAWVVGAARHRLLELTPIALAAAAALAVSAIAPSFAVLVVAIAFAGAGAAAVVTTAQAEAMRRSAHGGDRALSQFHVWGGAGAVVFPLLCAGLLAAGAAWREVFGLLALMYTGFAIANRATRVGAPPRPPRGSRPRLSTRARWSVVIPVVGLGIQVTFPLYLASLLVDHYGASAALGSAALSLYSVGVLGARFAGLRLLARLGPVRELVIACGLLLAAYIAMTVVDSTVGVILAAMLAGAGAGPLLPLGMARAGREIGDARYASGLVFSMACTTQVLLPAIVAGLLSFVPLQTAIVLTVPFALLVCAAVYVSRPIPAR